VLHGVMAFRFGAAAFAVSIVWLPEFSLIGTLAEFVHRERETRIARWWQSPVLPVSYVVSARRIADMRMILAGYGLANLLTRLN